MNIFASRKFFDDIEDAGNTESDFDKANPRFPGGVREIQRCFRGLRANHRNQSVPIQIARELSSIHRVQGAVMRRNTYLRYVSLVRREKVKSNITG
jgi:hypothetical protein